MKVIYVTSVYPLWEGDATPPFVQNQAKLMAAQGFTVKVLAPHSKGAAFLEQNGNVLVRRYAYMFPYSMEQLCYDGGMLIQLKAKPWTRMLLPLLLIAQWIRVSIECVCWKPDVIHSHSLLPQGLVCALASKIFRIPHVSTSHGNDVFGLKPSGVMGALKRYVLKESDAITVNSSATLSAVLELGADEERVHLIPAVANVGEVDASITGSIETKYGKGPKILFVGRFIEEKGVLDLLEAFSRVKEQISEVQCLFVGDGVLRSQMADIARELKIDQAVHFVGWKPGCEIASWMAAADVLVVPSKQVGTWQEAQGLVVVEAMSVGTPVIASRVGGLPDMVKDGETGRLFTPGNSKELAGLLIDFFDGRADSAEMVDLARKEVSAHYSAKVVFRKIDGLYQSIM